MSPAPTPSNMAPKPQAPLNVAGELDSLEDFAQAVTERAEAGDESQLNGSQMEEAIRSLESVHEALTRELRKAQA